MKCSESQFSRILQGHTRIFVCLQNLLFICLFASVSLLAVASEYYKYDVVATTGPSSIFTGFSGVSINDLGCVSFAAQTTSADGVFFWQPTQRQLTYRLTGTGASGSSFGPNTQINNSNIVAENDRYAGSTGLYSAVRLEYGSNPGSFLNVALGGPANSPFNYLYTFVLNPAINNNNHVVFEALNTGLQGTFSKVVASDGSGVYNERVYNGNITFHPVIADDDSIVFRNGNSTGDPIVLCNYNTIQSATAIADTIKTNVFGNFNVLGGSPGISDDGKIIAFYGEADSGNTLGTNSGPGIFISVSTGGGMRKTLRLTGYTNAAGVVSDLGADVAGNSIAFTNYISDGRISVVHQSGGVSLNDSVIVAFQATPSAVSPQGFFSNQPGLFTIKAQFNSATGTIFSTLPPNPSPILSVKSVVQLNDTLATVGTITGFSVADALAVPATDDYGSSRIVHPGEHRVGFAVTTATGGVAVLRASYLDTDEDGLPDHWETNGVTIGGQFINLPAMGADPNHKDIFVHVDWMLPNPKTDTVLQPKAAALRLAIKTFNNAPVQNPDGTTGIHLHIDAGPTSIMNPVTMNTWNAFSRAGAFTYKPIVNRFTDTDAARKIYFEPAKRAAIFHYALFGSHHPQGAGGESKDIPAQEFLITLEGFAPTPGGDAKAQAGAFIHELGHNLGLHHGGDDENEYKPNYLSLMNYNFTYTGLIKSDSTREFNYSTRKLPTLDENALNESVGISDPDGHYTLWNSPASATNPFYYSALPYPACDWNGDGILTAGIVSQSISRDSPLSVLYGFNDWPALVFDGGGSIGSAAFAPNTDPSSEPPDIELPLQEILDHVPSVLLDQQSNSPIDQVIYNPMTGDAPLTVNFDGSGSTTPVGTITRYKWDFGDGTAATGAKVTKTYTTPGTYYATLSLTNSNGYFTLTPQDSRINVLTNPQDWTNTISAKNGGFRFDHTTGHYFQIVTLTNGGGGIASTISLVLDGLSANATLVNKSGVTSSLAPLGSPYINAPLGGNGIFNQGQNITVTLEFANPSNKPIIYNAPRVLIGPGTR